MGRKRDSRTSHEEAKWLLMALVLLYNSAAMGQNSILDSVAFQFNPPSFVPGTGLQKVEVAANPKATVLQLQRTDVTCLGDFSLDPSQGFVLTLPSTNQPAQTNRAGVNVSGSCIYNKPVLRSLTNQSQTVTNFSTMFQVKVSPNGYIPGYSGNLDSLAFIVTSNNTTPVTEFSNFTYFVNLAYLAFTENSIYEQYGQSGLSVDVQLYDNNYQNTFNSTNLFSTGTAFLPDKSVTFKGETSSKSNSSNLFVVNVWMEWVGEVINVYLDGVEVDVNYYGVDMSYTLTKGRFKKSTNPQITLNIPESSLMDTELYVGFSGSLSNVSFPDGQNYCSDFLQGVGYTIFDWTFSSDGTAPDVPRNSDGTPEFKAGRRHRDILVIVGITVPCTVLLFALYIIWTLYRRNSRLNALAKKYKIDLKELDDLDRGAQNFKYTVLSKATKGFSSSELLGRGGFGAVYKGKMRLGRTAISGPVDVAVKRISATSSQGAQEFLAEVKIIGRAQHRNLVRLLGWCHEKGELLLVYEYMPNCSVDQHLFKLKDDDFEFDGSGTVVLTWARRLKIVSGVATALAFLHEEWEQRVIHRDIKSSNIMLDKDFNARLGDFGLARLSEHDKDPHSTAVLAGTHGYIAPELAHTLKSTEKTDVYSFGAVVLEMATGKTALLPLIARTTRNEILLVDWVWRLYRNNNLLEAADSTLNGAYDPGEMITMLKMGLLCSHPNPDERPTIREFLQIWKGSSPFPPLPYTKPVPVFLGHSVSMASDDTEPENSMLVPMEEWSESDPPDLEQPSSTTGATYTDRDTKFMMDDTGYSQDVTVTSQQYLAKRSKSPIRSRHDQRPSARLPM